MNTARPRFWFCREEHFLGILIGPVHIRFKGPKSRPFFSERNGYDNPKLRLWGWRLFIERTKY